MKIESKNPQTGKILFITLFSILILSSAISAQTIRICNESGVDSRLARLIYRDSSLLALDCGGLGTQGCHSWLWNWKFIGNGYCDEFIPGNMRFIYFAVQLRDKEGNWYSTSYSKNQEILDSWDVVGWSGVSGVTMCVKNDTYGAIYDRILKGKLTEVHNEVCKTGYSKVAVNLTVNTDQNTNYTVTLPYEAPPVKKIYPNTYRDADGVLRPSCGYKWANSVSGDYTVALSPGFVTTPTGVLPARGYRWVKKIDTAECSVEPIPTVKPKVKKTTPRKRAKKTK